MQPLFPSYKGSDFAHFVKPSLTLYESKDAGATMSCFITYTRFQSGRVSIIQEVILLKHAVQTANIKSKSWMCSSMIIYTLRTD